MKSGQITAACFDVPWLSPPERLSLAGNAVHVWRASLDQRSSQADGFLNTLDDDERSRAGRFYFSRDRERFIVARGVLRALLGRYLNRAPESLAFSYNTHGKPALDSESDAIRFNLSHSHGTALYAVTRGREIGVDLEFIRCDLEAEQIAERFFSHREIATLRALPLSLRKYAFFLCWTRKEAYIKARGDGLSMPLDQFDVSLIPGEPAALLSTQPDRGEAVRWSLWNLTPASGYAAALAAEGRDWTLSCWQWPLFGIER
ncbi:MAG: 4'-phosphopantetheinyl transferase superfamily protein [Candidatus Binatus sp.]|uniref:4'-phosphopantetheinyl transferase family protein n=1 Tax=Candidatus Binatus sp. TaxID=2811406 RepID=UPI003C775D2D